MAVQTTADLAGMRSVEARAEPRRIGWWQLFWRFLMRDKIGAAAFAVFTFFVLLAIFGPLLTAPETTTNLSELYNQPTREHILGTDYAGHDNFIQVVRG